MARPPGQAEFQVERVGLKTPELPKQTNPGQSSPAIYASLSILYFSHSQVGAQENKVYTEKLSLGRITGQIKMVLG